VHASADGAEVATPMCVAEWMLDFYAAARPALRGKVSAPHATSPDAGTQRPMKRRRIGSSSGEAAAASTGEPPGAGGAPPAADERQKPYEGVCRAGELIFVPRGWWHAVMNVEPDTIAITQNYVSPANLPHVLRFLRDMPYAVSGVPAEDAASLYDRFVAALATAHPAVLAQALREIDGEEVEGEGEGEGGTGGQANGAALPGGIGDAALTTAGAGAASVGGAAAAGSMRVRWASVLAGGVGADAGPAAPAARAALADGAAGHLNAAACVPASSGSRDGGGGMFSLSSLWST
jgi:hypothetical protein